MLPNIAAAETGVNNVCNPTGKVGDIEGGKSISSESANMKTRSKDELLEDEGFVQGNGAQIVNSPEASRQGIRIQGPAAAVRRVVATSEQRGWSHGRDGERP